MTRIARTELDVFPLCLGGNVFGWTADERESFAVLDAFVEGGGNFIDTADTYSSWIPGNHGGESERVIGKWLAARKLAGRITIATKVGKLPSAPGLSARNIHAAVDASLARLGTSTIDLYYAHADDPQVPLEETLGAFDALIKAGKVRYIAASNYDAPRLAEALATSQRLGLARYVALQPHYNLVERAAYEGPLSELSEREGLACFPYFALARGFLTGKYRPGQKVESARSEAARAYLDERGARVLSVLDAVSEEQRTTPTAVAIAWLLRKPTVVAPIASARTVSQVAPLLEGAHLELSASSLARLDQASQPAV